MNASYQLNKVAPSGQDYINDESNDIDRVIDDATAALLKKQNADGHWAFELEADATIPAEYIILGHFLGNPDKKREQHMAAYLRRIQGKHGGWPLFHDGPFDISASVKAYFALKCAGDSPSAPHMANARAAILAHGGAAKSNVFTRIQLALFGFVPWRAVPVMPVEIMLLPRWFPFHLSKVSYWSRTVIVPLLVLMALKPRAVNPNNINLSELFTVAPEQVRSWHTNLSKSRVAVLFRGLDALLRVAEPFFPKKLREKAIQRALSWVRERINGEDGLGAIYPAMANAIMMFNALGLSSEHDADAEQADRALQKLIVDRPRDSYCQPCLSPVWDTALACHALIEADASTDAIDRACAWLLSKQVVNFKGDWADVRPDVEPGGWAFQYTNDHYPDLDDTVVVVMALDRHSAQSYRSSIDRAVSWVLGMQSSNGGWGAFDADNTHNWLNHIPFADHGALLDPPTSDVTARCLSMMAQIGYSIEHPAVDMALHFLRNEQEKSGAWFGRWGTNYIYGTWSVLCALNAIGVDYTDPIIRKAVDWLLARQRDDGSWGEDGISYWQDQPQGEGKAGTPSQTAWALLALMAAGEVNSPAVAHGVRYLIATQNSEGLWDEPWFTAVGFPRVFYLRYHGYSAFFPLWALARWRNLSKMSQNVRVTFGM